MVETELSYMNIVKRYKQKYTKIMIKRGMGTNFQGRL